MSNLSNLRLFLLLLIHSQEVEIRDNGTNVFDLVMGHSLVMGHFLKSDM